ncbi:conserved hypothetical protein [Trichinella spiralis]|uniref:hypothetical protein n=1 Tax=Trichinella spiralis TaxID=6334 RepID=UPI0001EFD30A|nr:conserved hypothetical protein [Trichinella spiralis]
MFLSISHQIRFCTSSDKVCSDYLIFSDRLKSLLRQFKFFDFSKKQGSEKYHGEQPHTCLISGLYSCQETIIIQTGTTPLKLRLSGSTMDGFRARNLFLPYHELVAETGTL